MFLGRALDKTAKTILFYMRWISPLCKGSAGKIKIRNAEIDIWRVVFAIVVLMMHSHFLNNSNVLEWKRMWREGVLVLEGFFIISGLFMAKMYTGGALAYLECGFALLEKYSALLLLLCSSTILQEHLLTT